MKKLSLCLSIVAFGVCLACLSQAAETNKTAPVVTNKPVTVLSIFKDKNLEAAVRKYVFEKRDTDKPITEADVVSLSTISGPGLGIKDLTGLDKCKSLASLDLSKNSISDISALKGLTGIQYLHLGANQIEDISPLSGIIALQYIELSGNKVKTLEPLTSLTNLNCIYMGTNKIADIKPIVNLPRLSSLYLEHNQIQDITGLGNLGNLSSLSLSYNKITDIAAIEPLRNLYFLFLEGNKIKDLTPFYNAAKKDYEGEKRFSPFVNVFLTGNPLNGVSKKQLSSLKEFGTRVTF
jgi:internalin A